MTSQVAFVVGDGVSFVLKRCDRAEYLPWLRREACLLRALAGSGVPVPRAIAYAEEERVGWLAMTWLAGSSAWRLLLDAKSEARPSLLRTIGTGLARLHATRVPAALWQAEPWVTRRLREAEGNLAWCDGDAALLARIRATTPAPVPEALIHGDLALDNLLVADDGSVSFIDWSSGGSGDPRCDVALALQTEPELVLRDVDLAAFADGYGRALPEDVTRRWFEDLYEFF